MIRALFPFTVAAVATYPSLVWRSAPLEPIQIPLAERLRTYVRDKPTDSLHIRVIQVFHRILVWLGLRTEVPLASQREMRELFDRYVAQMGDPARAEGIREFFFNVLSRLDLDLFDRTWVTEEMELFLMQPEIDALPEGKPREEKRLRCSIDVALKLGVLPEKDRVGAHGSLIYRDCRGKRVGIFKAFENAPRVPSYPYFRSQGELMANWGIEAIRYADRAAYLLDEHFEFEVCPMAINTILKNREGQDKEGTLIFWEQGCTSSHRSLFHRFLVQIGWRPKGVVDQLFSGEIASEQRALLVKKFQYFVLFDYLLGNLDRHEENWLIRERSNAFDGIVAIDNTNTFPPEYLTEDFRDYFARNHMYEWKYCPFAKEAFIQEIRTFMQNLTEEAIEAYWEKLVADLPAGCLLLTEARKNRLVERALVLQEMGEKDQNATPALLGSLYSEEAIGEYLETLEQQSA